MTGVRRILLLGGGTGVVGRGIVGELADRYTITSYHRNPAAGEGAQVRFVQGDLSDVERLRPLLRGQQAVVNVVWYRAPGPDRLFAATVRGLQAVTRVCREEGVGRFVQISLPPAPPALERAVPYLRRKREFEAGLLSSGLDVVLIQPSAIFAPGDRLIGAMLRLLGRHGRFPYWGDGGFHLSPIWNRDVGWLVGEALEGRLRGTILAGGPERITYAELLERLQRTLGRRSKLLRVSVPTARRVVQLFNAVGWHVLYTYEFDWLVSDMLGLPPAPHEGRQMRTLSDFLASPS